MAFNVPVLDFPEVLHLLRTPTSGIFGKADLFGLVEYIVIKMREVGREPWILDSTQLKIVGFLHHL